MAGEDKSQVEDQQPDAVTEAVDETVAADATVEPVAAEAADIDALQLELAQAQDQIAALKDQELRTRAEMQNIRRRAAYSASLVYVRCKEFRLSQDRKSVV